MTRDEYVTSMVLDHGLTMDQVRQKVIEAGFDPLPPEESGQSKSARLKEELQHGVESTKTALRAQFGKLTFNDYDYEEGDTIMVAADFALNGKVWTLFGTAFENQIDNYAIANLKNGATKEELAGVHVGDIYYGAPLVRKFVNEFMSTNESTHILKEYRQEELNQMQKCDSLISGKISDWRTARAYNNEYAYDESTKAQIELPILEGKTFRHAITNPRDKKYIAGVEGYGPESDTERIGVRDDAEAAAREAEEQDLEDFWGNDPQSYRNKYAPRFPWIQNDVPEDDLEGDEITALDYPSEEMLASWAEDDPSGMEHFEPEEDSAIAVLPADMDDEEVDDDVYY